jgi:hypothetical protein
MYASYIVITSKIKLIIKENITKLSHGPFSRPIVNISTTTNNFVMKANVKFREFYNIFLESKTTTTTNNIARDQNSRLMSIYLHFDSNCF